VDRVFNEAFTEDAECIANLPGRGRYWLYVGDVNPRKNLERVVRVLAGMEARKALVVVGPDSRRARDLQRYARERSVEVLLRSGLTDVQVTSTYRNALGVIYVSLVEGFGFPLVEGLAVGVPVIASNTSSLMELGGGAAFQVDPESETEIGHAMRMVSALSQERRKEWVERGKAVATRYRWSRTIEKHMAAYVEIGRAIKSEGV